MSPVHFQEISAIRETEERLELESLLTRLQTPSAYNVAAARADALYALGFGIADAAHVAFAEQVADVFISCDDRLLKKCRKTTLAIVALNPMEFAVQEDLQ